MKKAFLRAGVLALLLLAAASGVSVGKAASRARTAPATALKADTDFGDRAWGIATLSVASAREQPDHTAELGTQVSLGHTVRLLQHTSGWFQVEAQDGYRAWVEDGTIVRRTQNEVQAWENGPLVVVTSLEAVVFSKPDRQSEPVSDVVVGNLLKPLAPENGWLRVELPDGRAGFLESGATDDYRVWRSQRQLTPENIEATARRLIGRPYLWGGNSPKGLDCSGFTQLVFRLNGIELPHKASQQAARGTLVPLDKSFSQLRTGDLLFFGHAATPTQPERVFHVGIYLGGGLVIHSSERVQISHLDALVDSSATPGRRALLRARRLLD